MVARRALPVLIALLPAVVPATANAAFAERLAGSSMLSVTAGSEQNTVTVTLTGSTYTITDSAGMGEGANCDPTGDPNMVTCPAGPVASFTADLGPGDDKFTSSVATPAEVLGGPGKDSITGGPGADRLVSGPDADTVNGGDGPDMVFGDDGDDQLSGGAGNDQIGAGDERGQDVLDGGSGDDVLLPGAGPVGSLNDDDVIDGGTGVDEVTYAARTTPVVVKLDGLANDGLPGEHDDIGPDIEKVTGGSADDNLGGSANGDALAGGPGADVIDGGAGADDTEGGDGNDTVSGGAGDDMVAGGAGDDMLNGSSTGQPGAGKWIARPFAGDRQVADGDNDTLDGGDGNDSFDGGPGADKMIGGAGTDTTSYASATSPVLVTMDGKPNDGQAGEGDSVGLDVENLGGWAGRDTFTGSNLGNAMVSAGGEDFLDGAGGEDSLAAGTGFDVVRSRDGLADTVDCGGSRDFAIVDKKDFVKGSCERVARGLVKRPSLGRSFVLRPLRGGEEFGLRGMHRTVPLKDTLGVPFGAKLDATKGSVRLTAAGANGRAQTGDFSGGAFLVKQKRSARGLTELDLVGGDLSKCNAAKRGRASAAAQRTVLRRLFGRARGRFRTRGRNSTATVRGTEWSVIDRCDGTLTTVKRGKVVVRDRVKHRTVTLRSGQSYLARRGNR